MGGKVPPWTERIGNITAVNPPFFVQFVSYAILIYHLRLHLE